MIRLMLTQVFMWMLIVYTMRREIDTHVNVRMNSVNGIQTHANTQSDSSTEVMVSGEARRNGSRRQAINDVCVNEPDVRVSSMSVGSDDNRPTRSVLLHYSNVMHDKLVRCKTKRRRMNDDCNEQLVHRPMSQLADEMNVCVLDDRHLTRDPGLNLPRQQIMQLQQSDSSLAKLSDLAKSAKDLQNASNYSLHEEMLTKNVV